MQFVSRTILNHLGFSTKRSARAAFYRRSKLLFDLETETSSINKSRAALLLASWSFSSYDVPRTPSTPWLSIAVHHAKDAEAHRFMEFDMKSEEHATRKRLWWGCIIRDRLLSLGMRRGIHIMPADFDFSLNSTLGPHDLRGELGRSMVYDPEVKECLSEVLGLLAELCIVLTDILDLAFPIEDSLNQCHHRPESLLRLDKSRAGLRKWYHDATSLFPSLFAPSEENKQNDSVVLYVTLLRMYY